MTADLPAKAVLLNMKQYNGKYGCNNLCEDEGVPRACSHLQRDWPYKENMTLRTHPSLLNQAKQTAVNGSVVCNTVIYYTYKMYRF